MNVGTACFERNMALLADGDLDGYIATFADDYTIDDRMPGSQVVLSGDQAATNARAVFELFMPLGSVEFDLLGVRDTHVCAHRVRFEARETGFAAELGVADGYGEDGRLRLSIFLAADEMVDGALDELAATD